MKRIFTLATAVIALASISCSRHIPTDGKISIIPCPSKVEVCEGSFELNPETAIVLHFEDEQMANATNFFNGVAEDVFGKALAVVCAEGAAEHSGSS